jgi:hypothetical protein
MDGIAFHIPESERQPSVVEISGEPGRQLDYKRKDTEKDYGNSKEQENWSNQ